MLLKRLAFLALAAAGAAEGQVRISGRVVEEGTGTPISGALLKVTGSDSTMTTGASGTFTFGTVVAGKLIVTITAPAYEFQSVALELYKDTVLNVTMKPRVVALDPMVVRPGQIRIKGTILDSLTGDAILFAQVSLYPAGRFAEASNIGRFTFDKVDVGDVAIVVEAMEHLPLAVRLHARRDTNLTLRLGLDSVAIRILGAQVLRLADRANASPFPLRTYDRDRITRENRSTVGDLVDRLMLVAPDPRKRAQIAAQDACVFYDDNKIPPAMLDGMYPELVERVEVYNHGAMIRVYSKQYVMSLAAKPSLRTITYMTIGMSPVCE